MKSEVLKNFIVLEGLDGSGTTTQLKNLHEIFVLNGRKCHITSEPTDHFIGKYIRKLLSKKKEINPATLSFLFAADRNEHIYNKLYGIKVKLKEGFVICDRYIYSSLAYQTYSCSFDFVFSLNKYFPLPEYLFYIDVPVDICQKRIEKRKKTDFFEKLETQRIVKKNYFKAIEFYKKTGVKTHIIDGRNTVTAITEKIWSFL